MHLRATFSNQSSPSIYLVLQVRLPLANYHRQMRRSLFYRFRDSSVLADAALCAKGIIWASALGIFLSNNVVSTSGVGGVSMAPTLSPDFADTGRKDYVLWNSWSAKRDIKRGDVAIIMSPNDPEKFAAKRVLALPGDTVLLDPRRRPEATEGPEPIAARAWDSWKGKAVVPPGHLWVEGDNWRKTIDSNWYGPVSKSLVIGKAVTVLWPLNRFWTKPWEEFRGKTKVVQGKEPEDWTKGGLPVELAEVGDIGLPKG